MVSRGKIEKDVPSKIKKLLHIILKTVTIYCFLAAYIV